MFAAALPVLFLVTPLLCWGMLLRTPLVGTVVGCLLAAEATGLLCVETGWTATRAVAEVEVAYAPVAAAVLVTGAVVERVRRGPRPRRVFGGRWHAGTILFAVYLLATLLVATPVYLTIGVTEAFTPSSDAVLPLPPGLSVLHDDPGPCGSGTCERVLVVGSPSGLSGAEIDARLRAGLTGRHGWQLDPAGTGCRRNGWLLDRRPLCVSLWVQDRQVLVELEGGDVYHGDPVGDRG
ncbi:hypothetical protein GCM10009665_46320 [Kitasatospora nipponensis]|uniref:Uncharacterized protein n=1 Tax=Kitasatospora nipponensis TaxID=258049 RepID=A0ABN1WHI1_9ACTN